MYKIIQSSNDVSLCYKNSCIHAKGQNANLLVFGAVTMLLIVGISALTKSN